MTRISVLASARPNSKYLAKYIMGYLTHTADLVNTELLVMASARDEWNKDLFAYFGDKGIRFFFEDYQLGRRGLHLYFNDLARHATGDWLLYMCEDHVFAARGWDDYVRRVAGKYNKDLIYVLLPKFKFPVPGHMSHILSRGYYQVCGQLGGHGNIDTWVNVVIEALAGDRKPLIPEELFDDLSHHPDPMTPQANTVAIPDHLVREHPYWYDDPRIPGLVEQERTKLLDGVRRGL